MKGNKILTAGFTGSRERANSAVDELLELGEDFIADLDDGSRFWHPFRRSMRLRHTMTDNRLCRLPASLEESVRKITAGKELA